jgi:hypothetical protein
LKRDGLSDEGVDGGTHHQIRIKINKIEFYFKKEN